MKQNVLSRKTFGERMLAGLMAAAVGTSCFATNFLGIGGNQDDNTVIAAGNDSAYKDGDRTSWNGDYEYGNVYYDIGELYGHAYHDRLANGQWTGDWSDSGNDFEYARDGWQIYNVKSYLDKDGDGLFDHDETSANPTIANTLPYTTDVNDTNANIQEKELMCWQAFASKEANRTRYLERADLPDFGSPTFAGDATPAHYIAKGTVTRDESGISINWEIRSWVKDSTTYVDPDVFTKTNLTGLNNSVSNIETYFSDFSQDDLRDNLELMWNKADFEGEGTGVTDSVSPYLASSAIDTWWKAVGANSYKADVKYDGTKHYIMRADGADIYTYDTRITANGATDVLGNNYAAALDATVSAYQYWLPGDDSTYRRNGSYSAYESDLASGPAVSELHYSMANIVGQNSVASQLIKGSNTTDLQNAANVTTNTFKSATFGHNITVVRSVNPKSVSVTFAGSEIADIITDYINSYYPNTMSDSDVVYNFSEDKLTMSKEAIHSLFDICDTLGRTCYIPSSKENYTNARYTCISGSTDYFRKFTRNGVKHSGLMELLIDAAERKGSSIIFNDTDAAIAAAYSSDANAAEGKAIIKSVRDVNYASDVDNFKFTFSNLATADSTRESAAHATNLDLTYSLAGFVNMAQADNDKVSIDETLYFTKGYQRAGGTLRAHRNSENAIETVASTTDANTNEPKQGVAKTGATITDVVEYRNLTPGTRYCIVGALYDAASKGAITKSGSPAIDTSATDVIHFVDEAYVDPTYVMSVKYFTPAQRDGSVEMTFNYDSTTLAGKTITVCDKLYIASTGTEIFSHNVDKSLETQSITIKTPSLGTLAKAADGTKTLNIASNAVINDTVQYVGLIPGQAYDIKAQVYDKSANALLTGVEKVETFTPVKADDTMVVTIPISTINLNNKELVVYETVYKHGTTDVVVEHKDKTDASQTVTVVNPEIKTVAADKSNKSKDLICSENSVILDSVTYSGLIIGSEYTLKTSIYDKDAETPAWTDVGTKTFTADATGKVSVDITLNTLALKGHHIVVGETILKGNNVIVTHKDVTDADQTVSVESPWLTTVATAADGESKIIDVEDSAVIIDKVSYGNLVPGTNYILMTQVIDKTADDIVADGIITRFQPITANGTVDVNINVNTFGRMGHEFVVFQYLREATFGHMEHGPAVIKYFREVTKADTSSGSNMDAFDDYDDGDGDPAWIVVHDNIDDVNQTVTVKTPAISTQAQSNVPASFESDVKDTLTYNGLKPNTEYSVNIFVVDVTDDDYNSVSTKPFVDIIGSGDDKNYVTYTFTTSATGSGSVDIINKIKIDTIALLGGASTVKAVIIEDLLLNGTRVLAQPHIDATGAQTFTVNAYSISTTATAEDGTSKLIDCSSNAVILDKVTYNNLVPNTDYKLVTSVWNATKNAYLSETATNTFTSSATGNGETSVNLTVDTSDLKNSDTLIVVQKLYLNDALVLEHFDRATDSQTVNVKNPGINTVATAEDGSKSIYAVDTAVVLDEVSYDSLTAGKTYTLVGAVYDRTANETDAAEVRVSDISVKTFTANAATGTVSVNFTFDARNYGGHKLVVREWLYEGTVTKDNYTTKQALLVHDGFTVDSQTVTVKTPDIYTLAAATNSESQDVDCSANVSVTDKVFFRDFPATGTYTIVTGLYDRTASKWINENLATNTFNAADITNATNTSDGVGVDIDVTLDTRTLAGHKLVFVETVKHNDKVIAVHDDKTDDRQTVTVKTPSVGTQAKDKATNTNILSYTSNAVIVDTVAYTNLVPGQTYKLLAKVWDKVENKFLDVDTTKTFKPAAANGTVDVEIEVNTLSLPSETLVVFEYLSLDGTTIAKHDNPDDEDQTVVVAAPGIRTTAVDRSTGEHTGSVSLVSVIDDTVHYEGLTPGKTYVLTAELYNKTTGEKVTAETVPVSFTPETSSGDKVVSLSLNTMDLGNVDLVVFETLTLGDEIIAVHRELDDADQTVSYSQPTIDTVATAEDGESKTVACASSTIILDKISYTGLVVGQDYVITTSVYDRSSDNKLIAQDTVTKRIEAENGDVTVNIRVDTTNLKGHQLVIGEVIAKDGVTILSHEDMTDNDQTVSVDIPNIRTNAKSKKTDTQTMESSATAVIVDRVTYSGLTVGKKYTVTATPYNKATGKPLDVDPVTVEFTATRTNGYVDVEVQVDTTKLVGQSIVMFESLKQNDIEIAVHNDINDEDQTVTVMSIKTLATASDHSSKMLDKSRSCKVIDKISYTGLTVGKTYVISGQLVDKNDASSVVATASIDFTPETADGTVEMTFTLDTTNMASKSFVAFETITQKDNGEVIGEHKDINDLDQTVTVVDDVIPPPEYPETGDSSNGMFNMLMAMSMFFIAAVFVAMRFKGKKSHS